MSRAAGHLYLHPHQLLMLVTMLSDNDNSASDMMTVSITETRSFNINQSINQSK